MTLTHNAPDAAPPPAHERFAAVDASVVGELRRFTVEEYHEMIRTGVLTSDDSVELLQGFIVRKMSENPIHAAVIYSLLRWLSAKLPDGFAVRGPAPVTTQDSEPEPDLVVARGREMDYADHHPSPAETVLLVEVANSSLRRDRGWKREIYAAAGTPEYWIINIKTRSVERFCEPSGTATPGDAEPDYASHTTLRGDDTLPFPIAGMPPLRVAELFPPASA